MSCGIVLCPNNLKSPYSRPFSATSAILIISADMRNINVQFRAIVGKSVYSARKNRIYRYGFEQDVPGIAGKG